MGVWKILLADGIVRDFEDTYHIHILGVTGAGMPPMRNIAQAAENEDGAIHYQSVAQPRTVQLACAIQGQSVSAYHARRAALLADINRDALGDLPFTLRYTGGDQPLDLSVIYEDGLSGGGFSGVPYTEAFGLRLLAHWPFWQSVDTETAALDPYDEITNADYLIGRDANGVWWNFGYVDAEVFDIYYDMVSKLLYVGGSFTTAWPSPTATLPCPDIGVGRIVPFDTATGCPQSDLLQGLGNGEVKAIEFDQWHNLMVGGSFTLNGLAETVRRIGWWDSGLSKFVEPLNTTGINDGEVRAMARAVGMMDGSGISPIYVAGTFTQVRDGGGGLLAYGKLTRWSFVTGWEDVCPAGDPNADVLALAWDPAARKLYAGGGFTSINGVSANRIAVYDVDTATWSAMGTGFNGFYVYAIFIGADGYVYAGGDFTTADGGAALRIAKWNGAGWMPVGTGVGAAAFDGGDLVRDIAGDSLGQLWVGAPGCAVAGTLNLQDQIAAYIQGAWQSMGINLPGAALSRAVEVDENDQVFVGYDTAGTAVVSGRVTVVQAGKAKAYPTITIERAGGNSAVLWEIVNVTTGARLTFNNCLIEDGETITIDLSPGYKTITGNRQGNLQGRLGVSDLTTWGLIPGNNVIAVMIVVDGAPTITAAMSWRRAYWSYDG